MKKQRYSFWRVFWVVFAAYIFFVLLGAIATSIAPIGAKEYDLRNMLTWRNILAQVLCMVYQVFFFYFITNHFYRLIAQKKHITEFVKTMVIGALGLVVYFTLYYFLTEQKQAKELPTGLLIFSFSVSSLFQLAFALLVPYLTYLRDEKKQQKILEQQKMQLEVEKSQANYNFLKAQINPHFLHNTLNFLYAKSLPYSSELSEGILTLADIMRYALGPAARDGKVALKDEIEHVRNVIKINQLRYSNNLNVHLDVNGIINGATIVPFILITIVENAFKHGDLKSSEHPIAIQLCVENGKMKFYCRNKKKSGPKEISTGIGLDNIKKQLDLTYGRNYVLNVKDEAEFYTTELTVNTI